MAVNKTINTKDSDFLKNIRDWLRKFTKTVVVLPSTVIDTEINNAAITEFVLVALHKYERAYYFIKTKPTSSRNRIKNHNYQWHIRT